MISTEDLNKSLSLQILEETVSAEPPAAFKPVYELVNSIIAHADSDPRKFNGFEKHWSPQVQCLALESCVVLDPAQNPET